jgi:hypothetical protein
MIDRVGTQNRYRVALIAGLVVVVTLQVALFAFSSADDDADAKDQRATAQLMQLPETEAPLADVAETLTPERADDPAPRPADVTMLAAIPSIPSLTASMANAVEPIMFMESLDQPDAEEHPAVTYATASDYLVSANSNAQALRPIDDRPVEVLAGIGAARGIGIGGDGPHCKPRRPPMFTRSEVVSGVPSRIGTPRM